MSITRYADRYSVNSFLELIRLSDLPSQRGQFIKMSPVQIEEVRLARIERATQEQQGSGRLLHDPLEDDPVIGQKIGMWFESIYYDYAAYPTWQQNRGRLRAIWMRQAHILERTYGILWFNLQQMNPPGIDFD